MDEFYEIILVVVIALCFVACAFYVVDAVSSGLGSLNEKARRKKLEDGKKD